MFSSMAKEFTPPLSLLARQACFEDSSTVLFETVCKLLSRIAENSVYFGGSHASQIVLPVIRP